MSLTGKDIIYDKDNDSIKKIKEINKGFIEQHNGFKVLFISGSNYDMGYQYGYLLRAEYLQNIRAWLNCCEKELDITYNELKNTWDKTKKDIPPEYIEEIKGRADALNISFEKVAAMDMISKVAKERTGCFSMAAWGPATSDGELYHLRSQDFSLGAAVDPVSKIPAYENRLIVVRKPDDGYASIFLDSPNNLGIEGGFNKESICTGWNISSSEDKRLSGIPIVIRQLMVLDKASNLDEAINILNSKKTIGCNLIVSDGKKPEAVVIEQSANNVYTGRWDNPTESNNRNWQIDYVLRRTNFFISSLISKTQPGSLYNQKKFLWIFLPLFRHYVAVNKGIEKEWGRLDLKNIMDMTRYIYNGKTDFLFAFYSKILKKETFNQWVACPKTGDILFSFAKNKRNAHESSVYHTNFFNLLKSID